MDTLAYAKRLESAGVPERQAEVQAEALAEVLRDQTITRADLREALQAFERKINIEGVRQDIADLKQAMESFKQEVRQDIESFKQDVRQDIASFKQEVRQDVESFKQAVRQDIGSFKQEVRQDIKDMRRDIGDVRQDVLNKLFLRLTGVISIATAILGILIGVFH